MSTFPKVKKGEDNILVTSALPYVNNTPHLGNLIGCVLSADVYARWCRQRGLNVAYVCGTDEYGTATETKAREAGMTPQEICDKYHEIHKGVYDWFNIKFDYFGRTTTEKQTEIAQGIFLKLKENDLLVEETIEQLFCETCDKFLSDRLVNGTCPKCGYEDARGDQCDLCSSLLDATELVNARCAVDASKPVIRETDHYFLNLPALQPQLQTMVDGATGKWTKNCLDMTRGLLAKGLEKRCITRDLKWGTPVPLEGKWAKKVFYVWFDAPIGYISITANATDEWKEWWLDGNENVRLVQFMGKDNVPFHSIIFPGCLMGTGQPWTTLQNLSTTDYLQYESGKFSKSRKTGVFGDDARDTGIPAFAWRYYLLSIRPETSDSEFSWDDFAARVNGELLANLGNFINRTLKFTAMEQFGGVQPPIDPEVGLTDEDKALIDEINAKVTEYNKVMEGANLRDGVRVVMEIGKLANKYYQDQQPWVLFGKDKEHAKYSPARCGTVMHVNLAVTHLLTALMEPFMPSLAAEVRKQAKWGEDSLTIPDALIVGEDGDPIVAGHQIGEPAPLVGKLEKGTPKKLKEGETAPPNVDVLRKRFQGPVQAEFQLDMRAGSIVDATEHPEAEKLWILKVECGTAEPRTIVSGLREHYATKEDLIGKSCVILHNLKARKFVGVQSQGMLLTAVESTGRVTMLSLGEGVKPGQNIEAAGTRLKVKQRMDFKLFEKIKLVAGEQGNCLFVDEEGEEHVLQAVSKVLDPVPIVADAPAGTTLR